VLDGLDGRLARLLKSESLIGAELDSLADFVNFGVAPMLLIYFWGLQGLRNEAWIAMLLFSVCCVIRLARFNVGARAGADVTENLKQKKADFFTGIPSPAGAILAMLPMYLYFMWGYRPMSIYADIAVSAWVVFIGLMMISRVPTFAFKRLTIARKLVRYFMIGFVFFIAALLTYTWLTLAVCSLIYLVSIPFSIRAARRASQSAGA